MLEKLKPQRWSIASVTSSFIFLLIYFIKTLQYKQLSSNLVDTSNFKVVPLWIVLVLASFIFFKLGKSDENGWLKKINYWINPYFYLLGLFYLIGNLLPGVLGFGLFFSFVAILLKVGLILRMQKVPFDNYMNKDQKKEEEITQIDIGPGDFVIGEIYKRNLDETGETPPDEDDYIPANKTAVVPLRDRFVHFLALGVTGSGKTSQSLLPMFNRDFTSDNFRFAEIDVVQMGQIVLEPKGDFAKATWAMGKIKEAEKKNNYIAFLLDVDGKIKKKINSLAEQRQN